MLNIRKQFRIRLCQKNTYKRIWSGKKVHKAKWIHNRDIDMSTEGRHSHLNHVATLQQQLRSYITTTATSISTLRFIHQETQCNHSVYEEIKVKFKFKITKKSKTDSKMDVRACWRKQGDVTVYTTTPWARQERERASTKHLSLPTTESQ